MSEAPKEKAAAGSSKSKKAVFRPNFTLSIIYLLFFFFFYAMLFMFSDLMEFQRSIPLDMAEAEQKAKIAAYAQQLIQPRWIWMLGAALATTALGIYAGVLPGVRPKR